MTHLLSNFTSPYLENEEIIETYKLQLKDEKIVNIPNAISKEILEMAKPQLGNYPYWRYSIKNSNTGKDYYNLDDPEIIDEFKKCKSDYKSLIPAYRFKKSTRVWHYGTCYCIMCKITETMKDIKFTNMLSKIAGFNLVAEEIFMSNYGEGDFLNKQDNKGKGDIAVTISFTYDWNPTYGGIIHFTDTNNQIYKSLIPGEGDINIFLLGEKELNYFVSPVAVNKNRYTITSWYSKPNEIIKNPSQQIHFCSFASTFRGKDQAGGRKGNMHYRYDIAIKRLQSEAEQSGFFDTVDIYNELTCPGIEKYSEFIEKSQRGYGYWIWKPLILLDMMNKYKENSIIVYADSGCSVIRDNSTIGLFNKYINDVNTHESHRLGFVDILLQYEVTKQDLFEYMDMNEEKYKNSKQLHGGLQILLNNNENRKLMEEWLEIMNVDNHHLLDDTPSKSTNHTGFILHIYDQSIIGLLKKKYGFCEEECTEYGKAHRILPIHPSWKRDN